MIVNKPLCEQEMILNVLEGRLYKIVTSSPYNKEKDLSDCVWLTFQEALEMDPYRFDVGGVYGLRKWVNGDWVPAHWSNGKVCCDIRRKVVK